MSRPYPAVILSPRNSTTPGIGAAPITVITERSSATDTQATNPPRDLSCFLTIKILQLTYFAIHCRTFLPSPLKNSMNGIILSVEHLGKRFKSAQQIVDVLTDVSFSVEKESTCAIIGPSGSGKTTLIAVCAGLERPSEGAVFLDGVALHRSSEEELARLRNQSIGL